MKLFQIKARFTAPVLFELECESLKICVEAAVDKGAFLRGADLRGADLGGADLRGAFLRGADLDGANLRGADLRGAFLRGAYLGGADLGGAYLGGADLGGADLRGADLGGANLGGAFLDKAKIIEVLPGASIFQAGPLGSRQDFAIFWRTTKGIYVRAGCFFDTLAAFESAVTETHGDNEHGVAYRAVIAAVKAMWNDGEKA